MNTRSLSPIVAALALVCAGALFASCSKKDSTSPPVVTGPTFNFTFPLTGTSHQFTFNTVGSWNYACSPHGSSGMAGTVIVSGSSLVDSVVVQVGAGGAFVYSPSTVTIKTGGSVRWVNVSGTLNHTVTR